MLFPYPSPSIPGKDLGVIRNRYYVIMKVEEVLIKNGRPLTQQTTGAGGALSSFSLGERIRGGRTLLKVGPVVTAEEIEFLVRSCTVAADEWKEKRTSTITNQKTKKEPIQQEKEEKEEATKTSHQSNINKQRTNGGGIDLLTRLQQQHLSSSTTATDQQKSETEDESEGLFFEQGSQDKIFVRLLTKSTAERESAPDDVLPKPVSDLLEQIFLRTLEFLDKEVCSSLRSVLFGSEEVSIAELFQEQQLKYSSREPAINVYDAPYGQFAMHKDHHALSIVIPLSDPKEDFVGGGTAFWNQSNPVQGMDGPSLVLRPQPGTAMVWGGRVSHKGVRISEGRRVVFVASFSGPDSPPMEDVQERFSAGLGVRTILSGR